MNQPQPTTTPDFETFAATHASHLAALAYLMTGDRAASREIVADGLVDLYRCWHRVRSSRHPRLKSTAIVVDEVLSHARRSRPDLGRGLELRDHLLQDAGTTLAKGTEQGLEWEALADLHPRERVIVVLRCYADLTDIEIGQAMRWRTPRPGRARKAALGVLMSNVAPQQCEGENHGDPQADFELRVRASLRQRAAAGPDPMLPTLRPRLAAARQKSRHSPARLVAAVLVVGATITAGFLLTHGPDQDQPEARATAGVARTPDAPAGTRLMGYREVAIAVPRSWVHDQAACGRATADTVIYPDADLGGGCRSSARVSSVTFGDAPPYPSALRHPPRLIGDLAGQQVRATGVTRRHGLFEQLVTVPGAGVQLVVRSPDRTVVASITASVRAVPAGFAVVPVCERQPVRDAVEALAEAGLAYRIDHASLPSTRYGAPPVTFQTLDAGMLVPLGTEVGLTIPST